MSARSILLFILEFLWEFSTDLLIAFGEDNGGCSCHHEDHITPVEFRPGYLVQPYAHNDW